MSLSSSRPPCRSIEDLRSLTPARVGLGRTGASLPTRALLDFTLDHARARDAVHAAFDGAAIEVGLGALGLETLTVASCCSDRKDYLKRPDLGRRLDRTSRDLLVRRGASCCDVAIVVADGLSPAAVNAHAVRLVRALTPKFAEANVTLGPAVLARGARVALGDEIGALLGARLVIMLIGERPGLSAPHSLGAYLTFAPKQGLTDAARNCVSNVHATGLSHDEAAFKIAWLICAALLRGASGVALKDESGVSMPVCLGAGSRPA